MVFVYCLRLSDLNNLYEKGINFHALLYLVAVSDHMLAFSLAVLLTQMLFLKMQFCSMLNAKS